MLQTSLDTTMGILPPIKTTVWRKVGFKAMEGHNRTMVRRTRIRQSRGCFSDLLLDMMKPAANQAFGSKSSFGQQFKLLAANEKNKQKNTKSYFRKTAFIFGDKKIPPPKSWRQITFCKKRRFHHIWQQITDTPSEAKEQWRAKGQAAVRWGWTKDMERDKVYDRG